MLVVGPLGCELQVVDLIEETNQFAEILVAEQFLEPAVGRQFLGRHGAAGGPEGDGKRVPDRCRE